MWPKLFLQAWWAILTPRKHLGYSETQKWTPRSFQNRLTSQNPWFFGIFRKKCFYSYLSQFLSFRGVWYLISTGILVPSGWRTPKKFFGPNFVPMAKNVHFHHPSPGPKMKMFATPKNLDSMIFMEEKCHIFIINLEKYGDVSFRGPNGPKKNRYQGIWPLFLVLSAASEKLLHN